MPGVLTTWPTPSARTAFWRSAASAAAHRGDRAGGKRDRGDPPAGSWHLPASLVSGGLPYALSSVAAHSQVAIHLDLPDLERYPASIEAALYFCCSEALQNAAKHGGPGTTVTIAARADARTLTLTISGRGFEPATGGTGLTNMIDRVSAIGGKLTIDTAPGRGTRIIAVVETAAQPNSEPSVTSVHTS
jgi:signal transduction histidine kinase